MAEWNLNPGNTLSAVCLLTTLFLRLWAPTLKGYPVTFHLLNCISQMPMTKETAEGNTFASTPGEIRKSLLPPGKLSVNIMAEASKFVFF